MLFRSAETPPVPTHLKISSLVSEYQSHPASSSASNAPLSELELLLARGRAYEQLVKQSREVVERATTLLRWASTQDAWAGELQQAWAGEAAGQHQRASSSNHEASQASTNRARLAEALQRERAKSRRSSAELEPTAAAKQLEDDPFPFQLPFLAQPAPTPKSMLSPHPSFLPSRPSGSASQSDGGAFLNGVTEDILRKKVLQQREAAEDAKRDEEKKRGEQHEHADRLAREQALRDLLLKDKKPPVAAATGAPAVGF